MVMRKRILITSIIIIVILIIGGFFMLNILSSKVSIPDTNARLIYIYSDKNIDINLSAEESETIKNMFNGKKIYSDNPSCGFTEDVSIRFDNLIFCIACDQCPIVKLEGKYFKISKADREVINLIFEKYGGSFPCV